MRFCQINQKWYEFVTYNVVFTLAPNDTSTVPSVQIPNERSDHMRNIVLAILFSALTATTTMASTSSTGGEDRDRAEAPSAGAKSEASSPEENSLFSRALEAATSALDATVGQLSDEELKLLTSSE